MSEPLAVQRKTPAVRQGLKRTSGSNRDAGGRGGDELNRYRLNLDMIWKSPTFCSGEQQGHLVTHEVRKFLMGQGVRKLHNCLVEEGFDVLGQFPWWLLIEKFRQYSLRIDLRECPGI